MSLSGVAVCLVMDFGACPVLGFWQTDLPGSGILVNKFARFWDFGKQM